MNNKGVRRRGFVVGRRRIFRKPSGRVQIIFVSSSSAVAGRIRETMAIISADAVPSERWKSPSPETGTYECSVIAKSLGNHDAIGTQYTESITIILVVRLDYRRDGEGLHITCSLLALYRPAIIPTTTVISNDALIIYETVTTSHRRFYSLFLLLNLCGPDVFVV